MENALSYRTICLLDTMGKLLEEIILQRLQGLLVGQSGLSENQLGFRIGRSTVDAFQAVVDIATNTQRGTGRCRGFCALISIKYLGVQLDRRLRFGEHLQIATAKAIQCGASLARLMANIGGSKEAKRRLVTSVVH